MATNWRDVRAQANLDEAEVAIHHDRMRQEIRAAQPAEPRMDDSSQPQLADRTGFSHSRVPATENGEPSTIYHYSGDTDTPSWIAENGTHTRTVSGLGGLAVFCTGTGCVLDPKITTLHGDLVVTIKAADTSFTSTHLYDEYGQSRTTDIGVRHGWIGPRSSVSPTTRPG